MAQDELFPIIDEDGNVIGKATRRECHSGSMLLHPVVHLHVFNSKGEFLYNTKNRRGRGGNEYFSINEYTVIDGNVYIMNHDGKIVVYDPDLNLKESFQTQADGYSFWDFCMFNQDVMAFRTTTLDSIIWQFYSKTQAKTVGSCRLPCKKRVSHKSKK